jgi:ethanolamine utilization protein EutJ
LGFLQRHPEAGHGEARLRFPLWERLSSRDLGAATPRHPAAARAANELRDMTISWDIANARLEKAAQLLNDAGPAPASGPFHVGVDLGTADIVVMVLDAAGEPVACFLEWAEVVRDGVVVDYVGAVDIVRRLVLQAQSRLGAEFATAATSFPPGTDPRLSTYILETVGLDVAAVEDEPTCVAHLLELDRTAVVDIGGGTTGTAVVRKGKVAFSGDQPTGGRHISLVISGHYNIPFAEAEARKHRDDPAEILKLARPTLQRMSDIVAGHIKGHAVDRLILTGGTCCLPGVDGVFAEELRLPVQLPSRPLLLTPLAIASLTLR